MQQAPSPTVLDQIVNSGIMSQLQPSIQMAQAPSTPMEPQQMAIGGMVALNDGGFVDYSYDNGAGYAGGGELRGFAGGDMLDVEEPSWTFSGLGQKLQDWMKEKQERAAAEQRLYDEMSGKPTRSVPAVEEIPIQIKPVNEPETPLAHQGKATVKAEPSDEAKNTDKGSEYKSPVEIHSEQDAQPRREAGVKGAQLTSASTTSIPGLEPIPAEVARANTMRQIREDMQNTGMPAPTTTSTPAIERGVNALPTDWDNAPSTDDYKDQLEMLQRIYQGDQTGKL